MENGNLMLRWAFLSSSGIALFWSIHYFVFGSIPIVMPFGISRWWDVLIGPIWSYAVVHAYTNVKREAANFLGKTLTAGLLGGLLFTPTFILGRIMDSNFIVFFPPCLTLVMVGMFLYLVFLHHNHVRLLIGSIISLVIGVFLGLGFGLTSALCCGTGWALGFGLAPASKSIHRK